MRVTNLANFDPFWAFFGAETSATFNFFLTNFEVYLSHYLPRIPKNPLKKILKIEGVTDKTQSKRVKICKVFDPHLGQFSIFFKTDFWLIFSDPRRSFWHISRLNLTIFHFSLLYVDMWKNGHLHIAEIEDWHFLYYFSHYLGT